MKAAARQKPRECHCQDLKGKKSWDAEAGVSQHTKSPTSDLREKTYLMQGKMGHGENEGEDATLILYMR